MEAVIFIGIQASGKSTFYRQRFFETHVRINRDMLKTANRENALLQACLGTGQPFVIDKMNLTAGHRERYIEAARAAGFRVVGYFFQSNLMDCLDRNAARTGPQRIPDPGIRGAAAQLQPPAIQEGFDEIFSVRIDGHGEFIVEPWLESLSQ